MAEFTGTRFLFKKKPSSRPAYRVTADGWYSRIPPDPPEPPQPPAPAAVLAPPAPPAPPTPPAPPVPPSPPCPVAPHVTDNHPVLTLLLPSAFDEYLSEPDSNKGPDVYIPAPAPAPRWGQPESCTLDEFAIGADDDVQDAEEDWRSEGDADAEGGTEADTEAATEAGTAEDVFPEGAPGDVAEQCKKFWQFVSDKRRERDIETTWIINADQTPLSLEMPDTTTVDQTGIRSVPIRSAGYQKERVTVMLACTADGMKLKPWVFFKQKTVPKGILCDSVGTGNLKKPPPEVVVRWISRAWKAVPADLIKRAFLTCGISNALDGSEDGLAMAHRRSQLTAEVDVDDAIIADGFFGNNSQEPESDEEYILLGRNAKLCNL
ncbi:unnamed protein product [Closterium sp. NIES-53]